MKTWRYFPVACIVAAAFLVGAVTASAQDSTASSLPKLDKGVLAALAATPIQDEGRIKPLDTFAAFKLLKLNGKRSCKTPDGRLLSPVAWLVDVVFYPEQAQDYASFSVDTSDVIVAIGVMPHEKKRDRYSYKELEGGRTKLFDLARQYQHMEARERTYLQNQLLNLASNLTDYEDLAGYARFARKPIAIPQNLALAELFPGATELPLSAILKQAKPLVTKFVELKSAAKQEGAKNPDLDAISKLFGEIDNANQNARALTLFPPKAASEKEWYSAGDLIMRCFDRDGVPDPKDLEQLAALEGVVVARDDAVQFQSKLAAFCANIQARAQERGEYGRIPLEVAYYKYQFFYYALIFYILAFLIVSAGWLVPRAAWLNKVSYLAAALPTLLLATGITFRCIIRNRPPVTTLYETILFATAVAVILALIAELIGRKRIALSMGVVLGVIGVFLANKYEAREGSDTMPSMVAVLDTNFWLATHVTTIAIGYAAGIFSGALAHAYVFGRALGLKKDDPSFYDTITRMVYGIFCFGFVFTFIGTLLGGIWANESWGRFWGWDPKENGALLICLWQLIALHARMGGYIRDLGMNLSAIFCGMVVVFSWMGVNLLGVGLHSYGFTSGAMTSLVAFWTIETAVLVLGLLALYRKKSTAK